MSHGALQLIRRALVAQWRRPILHEVRRWSSGTTRKWSTPLAKTIADAVEVSQSRLSCQCLPPNYPPGYRPNIRSSIHAPSAHIRPRGLLHNNANSRPVRSRRRLHHLPRNQPNLWRTMWNMVHDRMARPGTQEQRCTVHRNGTWKRDVDE